MNTIRDAIRAMARRAAQYRRAPAQVAPAPAPIQEAIPDPVDDVIPGLEEDLGPVVAPAPDDPREACQPPTPGSYGWWTSHAWMWVESVYICQRCQRLWPWQPRQDPDHE